MADGVARYLVDPRGGEGAFTSVEAAWAAALLSAARKVVLCLREGEYAAADALELDVAGRELTIRADDPEARAVLRSPRPGVTNLFYFKGDGARVTLRDLHLVGCTYLGGTDCDWLAERCDVDGAGEFGFFAVGDCCARSRLSLVGCRVRNCGPNENAVRFKAPSGRLRLDLCELSDCAGAAVLAGEFPGCRAEVTGCRLSASVAGIALLYPCAGRAAGNAFDGRPPSDLLCFYDSAADARAGRLSTPFSDFALEPATPKRSAASARSLEAGPPLAGPSLPTAVSARSLPPPPPPDPYPLPRSSSAGAPPASPARPPRPAPPVQPCEAEPPQEAPLATFFVGGEGGHVGVQEAWDAAAAAGARRILIRVRHGRYPSERTLELEAGGRDVTLQGEGRATLLAPRPGSAELLSIRGDGARVTLRDLRLVGCTQFQGAGCEWTVERCAVDGAGDFGLFATESSASSRLTVSRCRITGCAQYNGVTFMSPRGALRLEECDLRGCASGVAAGEHDACSAEVVGCRVSHCPTGIRLLHPCSGRAEGNAVWACDVPLAFVDETGDPLEPFPSFAVLQNAFVFGSASGPPPGLAPLDTGPAGCPPSPDPEPAEPWHEPEAAAASPPPALAMPPWPSEFPAASPSAPSVVAWIHASAAGLAEHVVRLESDRHNLREGAAAAERELRRLRQEAQAATDAQDEAVRRACTAEREGALLREQLLRAEAQAREGADARREAVRLRSQLAAAEARAEEAERRCAALRERGEALQARLSAAIDADESRMRAMSAAALDALQQRLLDAVRIAGEAAKDAHRREAAAQAPAAAQSCIVCLERPVGVVLQPCGHARLCASCAERVQNCPECRAAISSRIRAFL